MFQLHFTGVYNWNGHLPSSESVGPYKLCGVRWPFSTPNLAAATLKFWPLASSAPSAAVEKPRQNEAEWGPPLTNNMSVCVPMLYRIWPSQEHTIVETTKRIGWVQVRGKACLSGRNRGTKAAGCSINCMCMCMYMYVYIYIYIYMRVCVLYSYMCIYIYTYLFIYLLIYLFIYSFNFFIYLYIHYILLDYIELYYVVLYYMKLY